MKLYDAFLIYIDVLNRIDVASNENKELSFSQEERDAVIMVQTEASNNEMISELLNEIKNSEISKRKVILNKHFSNDLEQEIIDNPVSINKTDNEQDTIKSSRGELDHMLDEIDFSSSPEDNLSKDNPSIGQQKVLTMTPTQSSTNRNQLDKAGFINNVIFFLLMTSVFVGLIIEIIYFM